MKKAGPLPIRQGPKPEGENMPSQYYLMTRTRDGLTVDLVYVTVEPDGSLAESAWNIWQNLGVKNGSLEQAEFYAFDHNGAMLLDIWKRDTLGQPMPNDEEE